MSAYVEEDRKPSSSRNKDKQLFEQAVKNPYNIFMTIHGAPLSLSSATNNEPMEATVPEDCILILITPPQAVVFSSPSEDTETFRFFQQKNWIKTLYRDKLENRCYGADNYVEPWAEEKVVPIDERLGDDRMAELEEEESSEESSSEEMSEDEGVYVEHADYERGKVRNKNLTGEDQCDNAIFSISSSDLKKRKKFFERKKSKKTENGFELLNNIQIFLPGDKFYNQFQEFDTVSQDFDAFYLGPQKPDYRLPLSGEKKDEVLFFPLITLDGTWDSDFHEVGALEEREVKKKPSWEEGAAITTTTHKHYGKKISSIGANRVPYFNRTLPVADHGMESSKKTTEQILNYIMANRIDGGQPKIIILNSCSPSRDIAKKKQGYYTRILESKNEAKFTNMIKNLSLRGQLFLQGRKRFCSLRTNIKLEKNLDKQGHAIEPLLPYWGMHEQFVRIDDEDLNITYTFIGRVFQREYEERLKWIETNQAMWIDLQNTANAIQPQFIDNSLFIGLYTVAATNKRRKVMKLLRENWIKLFGTDQFSWSWNNMIKLWNDELQTPMPNVAGGGRRKRKKTGKRRKTRRKKKNRKKRTKKKARSKRSKRRKRKTTKRRRKY